MENSVTLRRTSSPGHRPGQSQPQTSKRHLDGGDKALVVFLLLLAVAFSALTTVFAKNAFAQSVARCEPPAGYSYYSGPATDMQGNPVSIVRSVYTGANGIPGGKRIVVPPCGSPDKELSTVNGLVVNIDGLGQVTLASATVVWSNSSPAPLASAPQP